MTKQAPRLDRAARRRQLLEVAAELFAERGYRGTTTAELARAAGITEPILYRHFPSKLDLFVTLIGEVGNEVLGAWSERLEGLALGPERLRVILASNPATHPRGRGVYRVIFQAIAQAEREPEIRGALQRHLARLRGFVEAELEALQGAGVVRRDEPAAALARLLVDVAIGYGLAAPLASARRKNDDKEELQRLLEDLLVYPRAPARGGRRPPG